MSSPRSSPGRGKSGSTSTTVRVRRDIWHLQPTEDTPWDPIVTAYARAVKVLRRNQGTRQRHWSFQTQIHGMDPDPGDKLRNMCQHASWYFLPWHRMYLSRFEDICRSIIEEDPEIPDEVKSGWALPYWDYDRTDSNSLPFPFRQEFIDGEPNPLYEARRRVGVNDGNPIPDPALTRASGWFPLPNFSTPFDLTPSFGGRETDYHHSANGTRGALEETPHNTIHVWVGGPGGLMSSFNTAAGDPVFWLHHANVDRLWEVWRANTGQGQDSMNPDYLNKKYQFLDRANTNTTITPVQVVDTENDLGYRYEDISVPPSAGVPVQEAFVPEMRRRPLRLGSSESTTNLSGGRSASTAVPTPGFDENIRRATRPHRMLLAVEHITTDTPPDDIYGVYLDDPTGGERILVGTMSLFGIQESNSPDSEHEMSYTYDVTEAVAKLSESGKWDPDNIKVSFHSLTEPSSRGREESARESNITVGTVSLMVG